MCRTIHKIALITNLTQQLTADNGQSFKYGYDSQSGKYGYVVSEGGADTFVPFSSNPYQNLTGKYFKRSGSTNTIGAIQNDVGITGGDDMLIIFPHRTMEQRSSSQYGQITCIRADGQTIEYLTGYGPHTVYLGDVLKVQNNITCRLTWTE